MMAHAFLQNTYFLSNFFTRPLCQLFDQLTKCQFTRIVIIYYYVRFMLHFVNVLLAS